MELRAPAPVAIAPRRAVPADGELHGESVSLGADILGFGTSDEAGGADVDVLIFLRGRPGPVAAGGDGDSAPSFEAWWEHLGGKHSSVRDWSYLLVPHCAPSKTSLAAANVRGVSRWALLMTHV